jgi:hypothetical protein
MSNLKGISGSLSPAKGETAPGTSLTYLFIMILFKAMRKQAESFLEAGEASAD